ncbi:MAG: AMP-binding protein [Syntrophales bacterium]
MSFERSWHRSYAPGVPREMDFDKITMPEVLTRTAGRFPDRTALVFMGKKISYRELEALVNRFAGALTAIGVKAGDRVAMLLPNMPQFVIANYAAFRIGAVTVMNNPLSTEEELTYQLNDSDSTMLITLDLRLPLALALKSKTGIRSIIACHITDYLPFPGNKLFPYVQPALHRKIEPEEGIYEFLALLDKYPGTPVETKARWEETGGILYTEGTTGVSKGVMLTHANISCNTQQLRAWLPDLQDGKESIMAVFPFFHSSGWTAIQNMSILAGWTDILVPHPEPQAILEILKKHKPTILPVLPAAYTGLLAREELRKAGLSTVKGFLAGATPLSATAIKELKALRDVPVINVYGLTEICAIGTATSWGGEEKPGSAGVPLPGTDLRIVDAETGMRELPAGEAGEICFRGPQVMTGYCKKPGETAAALKDGWLFTGDIGALDKEGFLTILDKKKDLIVVDGRAIYPREIDQALLTHPQILEACAIGIPDGHGGKTVKVYVVLKPGETADAEEIIAHCRERLAPEKIPQGIEFIDALPKSALGKVLRREVREIEKKNRKEQA